MKDFTDAPGANLCLNVWLLTGHLDMYETLYVRHVDGRFVPYLDMTERKDDPPLHVEITEENYPIFERTVQELREIDKAAKAAGNDDLDIAAGLAVDALFQARVNGYTGVEGKYWTDMAPELLPLFEAERR